METKKQWEAAKMFTGFDTTSCQGRSGHTGTPHGAHGRCPGHWASLGRDYSALSHHSDRSARGVCWQPSPPCTSLLARKLMSKYFRFQAVPSPLPTPAARTATLLGQTGVSVAAAGLGAGKSWPNKERPSERGLEHSWEPSWVWGRTLALTAGSPKQLSPQLLGKMSISSEHKPLGKQVTGSLHMVSKVCAQGHNSLMWDQSTPAGLHLSGFFPPIC